ncbi:efflux RND transporter periplasmic adaptor subunit [Aestuariibacter salexigens]|uniref:efflux RND transporter periplasmic adaptor subunit n=1 Tax=Aestuariibacter salexigens TaxID=226010 RepID=UPI00041266DC|nr:efflux RND transporter periplasmic adaptor subunit [Aestuariibacter salexigens]
MKPLFIKIALPLIVLAVGVGGMQVIKATGQEETEKEVVDTRPIVSVQEAQRQDYQVHINSFGEVQALERTLLSAQVSGEVIDWHSNFVAGGLVLRDDILFSIEKDAYEAAVAMAESELSLAQAQLIEEQARADVAKQEAKRLPPAQVSDLYLRKPQLLSAQARLKAAQAQLQIARRDLANCDVKAPYDALVISRDIGVGQFVSAGAQVAQLSNIESAEIIFPIAGFDSSFLPQDIVGKQADVVIKGRHDILRSGTIHRSLGVIDRDTRMAHLVVRIDDPYSLNSDAVPIQFGSYAEITFNGQILNDVFRLPQSLVTRQRVWTVDEKGNLLANPVNIVREEGEYFLIDKGLNDNDQIVMTLPEYPQDGMAVKVVSDDEALLAGTQE